MDFFYFVGLLAGLTLPFHWAVAAHLAWCDSPAYFRRYGVIILRMEALEAHAGVIGRCRGAPIHESVTFKGMRYVFDGVVSKRYQARIGEEELYLDPGLLYVFCPGARRPHARGKQVAPATGLV